MRQGLSARGVGRALRAKVRPCIFRARRGEGGGAGERQSETLVVEHRRGRIGVARALRRGGASRKALQVLVVGRSFPGVPGGRASRAGGSRPDHRCSRQQNGCCDIILHQRRLLQLTGTTDRGSGKERLSDSKGRGGRWAASGSQRRAREELRGRAAPRSGSVRLQREIIGRQTAVGVRRRGGAGGSGWDTRPSSYGTERVDMAGCAARGGARRKRLAKSARMEAHPPSYTRRLRPISEKRIAPLLHAGCEQAPP